MRIRVESCATHGGTPMPRRLYLHGCQLEVAEPLDQWHGFDYRYVKVRDHDGNLYILRYDEVCTAWELTMFKSVRAQALLG